MNDRSMGKIVKDLPSSETNPRNSEGAFVRLSNNSILFAYSRFVGSEAEDEAPSTICGMLSEDDGESFGDSLLLLDYQSEQAINIMSVSLLDLGEAIGLFYLVRESKAKLNMCLRTSSDDVKTWSNRILCTPGETWSQVEPSIFTSPNSPLSIQKNRNHILYAIWNPIPEYNGREKPDTPYFLVVEPLM
ncbi:hypothetical protein BU202_02365 [Streptococcus cuniculi]|uniref:Exo-alpha-sialidase n=1 Tax=Streptococcus cuniculi TaxID=1432788 RepID=A0A1Q8E9K3_9STRE|nr:sialidase family protein [Streptococcus cuniculi]OLF48480.1 hypothetical protein BU202_02365 [Streptococcus cuniculi]